MNRNLIERKEKSILNNNLCTNIKILICSPSNGGCDEIARRLKAFNREYFSATKRHLSIVRLGRFEQMHKDIEDLYIDNLTKSKVTELITKSQCEKSNSIQQSYKNFIETEKNLKDKIALMRRTTKNNNLFVKILLFYLFFKYFQLKFCFIFFSRKIRSRDSKNNLRN